MWLLLCGAIGVLWAEAQEGPATERLSSGFTKTKPQLQSVSQLCSTAQPLSKQELQRTVVSLGTHFVKRIKSCRECGQET